jgi:hypothetical protein
MATQTTNLPPWNMCVFSKRKDQSDVKNALMYADHVYWVAPEMAAAIEVIPSLPHYLFVKNIESKFVTRLLFLQELAEAGSSDLVTAVVQVDELARQPMLNEFGRTFKNLVDAIKGSKCVVGLDKVSQKTAQWDTYNAVREVESAVGRLLLPDVSELPIEAILEIRNRTKDVLDPMRAELLRFTDDLRKMVSASPNDKEVEAGALALAKAD